MWTILNSIKQATQYFFTFQKDFYVEAQNDNNYKYYQSWCSDWRIALRTIISDLQQYDQTLAYNTLSNMLSHKVPSAIWFHLYLETLERKIDKDFPFLSDIKQQLQKSRVNFRRTLKQDSAKALDYFYRDIALQLIDLSGKQITIEKLLTRLNYYQQLISPDKYHAVINNIQTFSRLHQQDLLMMQSDIYHDSKITSSDYEALLAAIHSTLMPQETVDEKTEHKSTRISHRSSTEIITSIAKIMPWLALSTANAMVVSENSSNNQFDLSTVDGVDGFSIEGLEPSSAFGWSLAVADVNGDGFNDLIIGSPYASPNDISDAGQVCVIFGGLGPYPKNFNLETIDGKNGFCLNGVAANDSFGYSVAAGDVNGDKIADIVIGAPNASAPNATSDDQKNCGCVYIFFGTTATLTASINAVSFNGTNGCTITGMNNYHGNINKSQLGTSVTVADTNGDGIKDIIAGATQASNVYEMAGAVYVIFGTTTFYIVLSVTSLSGPNGFMINGPAVKSYAGTSVVACDINNDGYYDIGIGAWGVASVTGAANAGAVYFVFGGIEQYVALNTLNGKNGFVFKGVYANGNLGQFQALSCNDVNNDGRADLIASAKNAPTLSGDAYGGVTYIFLGQESYVAVYNASICDGTHGYAYYGAAGTYSGYAVTTGNFNQDNVTDVFIATHDGTVYVAYSPQANFSATYELSNINSTTGYIFFNSENNSKGVSLAVGDITGSNNTQVFIGEPYYTNADDVIVGVTYGIFNVSAATNNDPTHHSSHPQSNIPIYISIAIGSVSCISISMITLYLLMKKKNSSSLHTTVRDPEEGARSLLAVNDNPNYQATDENSIVINGKKLVRDKEIGSGGFGIVYQGTFDQKAVAIKQLKNDNSFNEIKSELEIMKKLDHENIVRFWASTDKRPYYIVMEYMVRGSLDKVLRADQTELNNEQREQITRDIAAGLDYLHSRQPSIIHRDLKSMNVLLDQNYRAKLCDFGLAKAKPDSKTSTSDKKFVGSYHWSAPEIFEKNQYSSASDMWSFGMVVYEIMTKKIPFEYDDWASVKHNVITKEEPLIIEQQYKEQFPKLAALIKPCWNKDVNARLKAKDVEQYLPNNNKSLDTGLPKPRQHIPSKGLKG